MKKFPINKGLSYKSNKSQSWNTEKQKSASGKVRTMTTQLLPAWSIQASIPVLSDDDANVLHGFVASVKGSHEPFLWLDPEDNRQEGIALAKISNTQYQAVRDYGGCVEAVEHIEDVTVYVNGAIVSNYSVVDGVVTFSSAPSGTVTADFTYYWKVCFSGNGIDISRTFNNVNSVNLSFEVVR